MSMGPLNGIAGSAAGTHRAQGKGAEVDQAQHATANQARRTESQRNAEKAAGVGQTEQDEGTSDRDADGRRLWEDMSGETATGEDPTADDSRPGSGDDEPPLRPDPSGVRGTQLDIRG